MKIGKVELFTQSDPRWVNDTMTFPPWQDEPDTIREYGCLLTSLTNAYNLYRRENKLRPGCFNNLLKMNEGYFYLRFGKDCPQGQESFLYWPAAMQQLGIRLKIDDFQGEIDLEHPKKIYIARAAYKNTGHYCIVIGGTREEPFFFDSYTGRVRKEPVTRIIEITFF